MPRLKLLQLADFRWYNASAHYALTACRALSRKGHKVYLGLTSCQNFPTIPENNENLEILSLPDGPQNSFFFIQSVQQVRELIGKRGIQVVNCHSPFTHILAATVRKVTRQKFALIRTRGEAYPPKANPFNKYLYRKLTDHLIAPAEILREGYISLLNLDPSKLSCVHLGIDCSGHRPGQKSHSKLTELGIAPDQKVVGMIGRLSPLKGHVHFIHAARAVLQSHPETKFVIAGTDAQISQERLKRVASQLGVLDNFVFLGIVPDLEELISLLDIGAVCSTGSETICRALLQFMAAGKPVVGSKMNGIQDLIIENQNGYLVPPADPHQLASAISRILSDPELDRRMGSASRRLVESKFSLVALAEETEKVYQQALTRLPRSTHEIAQ